ncbi:MAG TPA: ABC transporter ATP-binding protein [Polyangiaceae bacterium]|nr:ABC transporter ATP-binding protein [Polyangiaceae bacterium]
MLEVQDLAVSYGGISALRGISLTVGEGEIVSLVGANGAGKSSTLRAISGMLRVARGKIRFAGKDTTDWPSHRLVPLGLVHAPEGRGIFLNMSVRENLELGAYLRRDAREIQADQQYCFDLFPVLSQRISQPAGTLSGGEQQMLAISRALMSRPKLLLLDEPSLGLAPQVIERIFETIAEVNKRGVSVLLVEQNAQLALSAAHYAYVLETGELAMAGGGADLLAHPAVKRAYLGE